MPINPINTLKNSILSFVREFYDPNAAYADKIIEKWNKSFVQLVVWIIFNGLALYLVLSGISFIFPRTSSYIFIGNSYWQIPLLIIYSGIILWFAEGMYKFVRGGYKK